MQQRHKGLNQEASAAKVGISTRSGRRIEQSPSPRAKPERSWRTRHDPLEAVWQSELTLLLERDESLTGITLLEYLQDHYPEQYDDKVLRTLQRRVKQWRAVHGSDKEVMFRQQAVPARQGFSDFTHPDSTITIQGQPLNHLLYQFRLAFSGWRSVTVTLGGESYVALAGGLQRALTQAGGCPHEHRTDSLSAARRNRTNRWADDYMALCSHYQMEPTRNNLGMSHENGIVECAHGSLKRRLSQQLKLRQSCDFESIEAYQEFIDLVVARLNKRSHSRFLEEQESLQALPGNMVADYQLLSVKVTRSSTIEVRRVVYTVPSRLIGERAQVRLYHDHLALYVGQQLAETLPRVYPKAGQNRARSINYHHVIRSLVAKPQAFRYSQIRDDLLPSNIYRQLWQKVDQHFNSREACKWIVNVLWFAYEYEIEDTLGQELLVEANKGKFMSMAQLQERFLQHQAQPSGEINQHSLISYDSLLHSLTQTKPAQHEVGVPF